MKIEMLLCVISLAGGLVSCGTSGAPKGVTCEIRAVENKLRCYDTNTDKYFDATIQEADKFISRPPAYDQALANWCGAQAKCCQQR